MLPFTPTQFLALFVDYNDAIWPMQFGGYLLGCIAIALLFWRPPHADRPRRSSLYVRLGSEVQCASFLTYKTSSKSKTV